MATGNSAASTISVNATSLPVITAPPSVVLGVGHTAAITGVSLAEAGAIAGETFTVKLTDAHGLLSATGTGVSGSGSDALTISGTLAQVNADLATLKDFDATVGSDTISLGVTDSLGKSAASAISITAARPAGNHRPAERDARPGSNPRHKRHQPGGNPVLPPVKSSPSSSPTSTACLPPPAPAFPAPAAKR